VDSRRFLSGAAAAIDFLKTDLELAFTFLKWLRLVNMQAPWNSYFKTLGKPL